MRRLVSLALVALATAACTTPHTAFRRDINSLKGQPVATMIGRWGHPSEEKVIAGDTVYVWRGDAGSGYAPCTARVIAGPDGLIKGGDIVGSIGACELL